jgi:hypothetical protein
MSVAFSKGGGMKSSVSKFRYRHSNNGIQSQNCKILTKSLK